MCIRDRDSAEDEGDEAGVIGTLPAKAGWSAPEAAVFGKENRKVVGDNIFPWTTIGKLTTKKGDCTATLVGECVVITAAHCTGLDSQTTPGPATFVPRFARGSEEYKAKSVYLAHGVDRSTVFSDPANFVKDWAFVRLRGKPGDYWGWLGVKSGWLVSNSDMHTFADTVAVAGYNSDFGGGALSVDKAADMQSLARFGSGSKLSKPMLCFHADTSPGSSGGPIFAGKNLDQLIVGINTRGDNGKLPDSSDKCSGGVPSDYFFNELKAYLKQPCS